jgi:protein-tyrosine phosphatase
MEVNGRYWGSLSLSIQSGVDFPGLAWELAHGSRPEQPAYRLGVKARWTAGLILRQATLLRDVDGFPQPSFWRELPGTLGDLGGGAHDMLWTWRDPLPALIEAASALRWQLNPRAILRPLLRPVLLPLRTTWRRWRSLDSQCRPIFLKRRLAGSFRRQSKLPAKVSSVLFVCHGNIIRSPMAARLFRQRVDSGLTVASAGLHAISGKRADARAVLVSQDYGLPLDLHAACPLTKELVQGFDLIVVMDTINEAQLLARYPEAAPKVRLLGSFARTYRLDFGEIADPYAGSLADVRSTWKIIEDAATGLAACLAGKHAQR